MPAKKSADPIRRNVLKQADMRLLVGGKIDPPAKLTGARLELWHDFWVSDLAAQMQAHLYRPALERLFRMYEDEAWLEGEWDREPYLIGHKGQQVINPVGRRLDSVRAEIRQLEDRFGGSPRAVEGLRLSLAKTMSSLADLAAVDDD